VRGEFLTHEQRPTRQRVTRRLRERLAETHEQLPTRQRVTRPFRERLAERVGRRETGDAGRGPRRLSLDEAHHRRGGELATVVSDPDRRCVIEVLDGRGRRTVERWLSARRPKGVRRSGQHAAWRPELYRARHRLLKARERLTHRDRRRLAELFEREPILAEAWGLKERFRDSYHAHDRIDAERRLERSSLPSTARACPPSTPSPRASAFGERSCGLLRRAERPTATPRASSASSRSSSAAPTASPPSPLPASACP
jgi:hypothetical protein